MTLGASHKENVSWASLKRWIDQRSEDYGVILSPDYQRDHVWTDDQASKYLEWVFRGGKTGLEIHFNCPDWDGYSTAKPRPLELVDGKQRIKAVLDFLDDKVKVYGLLYSQFEDKLKSTTGPGFVIHVNCLKTRKEVMLWYVEMNSGGTVHSPEEISRVKSLISEEKA
jgi:hypothetical protein